MVLQIKCQNPNLMRPSLDAFRPFELISRACAIIINKYPLYDRTMTNDDGTGPANESKKDETCPGIVLSDLGFGILLVAPSRNHL